jgi:RHS repeat-associated protein
MPHHIESGTGSSLSTTDLQYTASGQRVVQRSETNNTTTAKTFIGDLYELTVASFVPSEHRYKILVGSRQIAEVVRSAGNQATYYLHDDHLGSVAAITNASNTAVEARSYDPFGSVTSQGNTTGVRASYTGHDDDAGLGLVNARGRLYDAKLGRFVSADPFTPNPGSSQGWNRYAYVENNPLVFVDPTGFQLDCSAPSGITSSGTTFNCPGAPQQRPQTGFDYTQDQIDAAQQEAERRTNENQSSENQAGYYQPSITGPDQLPGAPNPQFGSGRAGQQGQPGPGQPIDVPCGTGGPLCGDVADLTDDQWRLILVGQRAGRPVVERSTGRNEFGRAVSLVHTLNDMGQIASSRFEPEAIVEGGTVHVDFVWQTGTNRELALAFHSHPTSRELSDWDIAFARQHSVPILAVIMDRSESSFGRGVREIRFFDPSVGANGTIWTIPLLDHRHFGRNVPDAPALYAVPAP